MQTFERALGLALGALADAVFGDPQRWHPVAGFGQLAAALERLAWANSRARGVAYVGACVGIPVAVGVVAERLAPRGASRVLVTALCTWAVLGGRSLAHEAAVMAALLESGDVAGGRRRLSHLAGRDAADLDVDELARASVESVAENTSDAVVAPLIWGRSPGCQACWATERPTRWTRWSAIAPPGTRFARSSSRAAAQPNRRYLGVR